MGHPTTELRSRSPFRRMAIVVVFAVIGIGVWLGKRVYDTMAMWRAMNDSMAELNLVPKSGTAGGAARPFDLLPAAKRYGSLVPADRRAAFNESTDAEFRAKLAPDTQAALRDASATAAGDRFAADWIEGAEGLTRPQVARIDYRRLGEVVDFRKTRETATLLGAAARLARIEGRPVEAARTATASWAVARQLVSYDKQHAGLSLISAMMAIACINVGTLELMDGGLDSDWSDEIFAEVRPRLEAMDGLFSLVGTGMALERTMVPGFFRLQAEKARERGLAPLMPIEDVVARVDGYIPPAETYEMPYLKARQAQAPYERRVEADLQGRKGPWFYLRGLYRPGELIVDVLCSIAIPNFNRAFELDCACRARLHGCYAVFAVESFRRRRGRLPRTLDELAEDVPRHMLLDPFTGGLLAYDHDGPDYRLWTPGADGTGPVAATVVGTRPRTTTSEPAEPDPRLTFHPWTRGRR